MQRRRGFSLVEVTLAIGIVAFGLLAIFALVPAGSTASRDAANDTSIILITNDLYNRTRATTNRGAYFDGTFARVPLTTGPSPAPTPVPLPAPWSLTSPQTVTWYYDVSGTYRAEALNSPGDFSNAFYRADVTFGTTWSAIPSPTLDLGQLRPVTARIQWPLNPTNGAAANTNNSKFITFYLNKP